MTNDDPTINLAHLDALVDAALALHGDRLDAAQRLILRENAQRLRATAEQLDTYHLENADEPDFSFRAIDWVDAV